MPFQLNCSTCATPNWSFSGSASSKSSGAPLLIIGRSAPSAALLVPERLKKMLKNARKRCQATPIVTLSAITMNQAKLITILTMAVNVIAFFADVSDMPLKMSPTPCEIGVAQVGNGKSPAGDLEAADQEDAHDDREDRRLDVVRLPHGRAGEARVFLVTGAVGQPDRDQHQDADEA